MAELEYPQELPLASLKVLLDKVRGGPVSIADTVQAGWIILGYGLGKGIPIPPAFGTIHMTDEEALMSLIVKQEDDGAVGNPVLTVALSIVLKLAFRLISEYIS
jgi:hypothetical protein